MTNFISGVLWIYLFSIPLSYLSVLHIKLRKAEEVNNILNRNPLFDKKTVVLLFCILPVCNTMLALAPLMKLLRLIPKRKS